MTIKVGITGGIGSGKSTVCRIFKMLDVPVFEADAVARQLMNSRPEIKNELIRLFGNEIYTSDQGLNRKKLAEIIFNDDIQREKVNQVVHPVVRVEFLKWMERQHAAYIIHEAAILFESGFYQMMDLTILVTAPEEMRIDRVATRDGIAPEKVRERMEKQWSDSEKRKLASFELVNDDHELIIPKILIIDKNLKVYGKIW